MDVLGRIRRSVLIALVLSPAGLLLIAVVRLLIISNYNSVTATTIVASGGYVNTLLGTVIPLVPILLPYIGLVLLFFRRGIAGALTLAASAFISPTRIRMATAFHTARTDWHLIIAHGSPLLVPLAVATAIALIFTAALGIKLCARTLGTIISLALIPIVVLLYPLPFENSLNAEQLRQPWLPAETITLASHQRFVGYALSSDGDWLTVLRNDTRQVVHYPAAEISSRHVCEIDNQKTLLPIIALTARPATVPTCTSSTRTSAPATSGVEHSSAPKRAGGS